MLDAVEPLLPSLIRPMLRPMLRPLLRRCRPWLGTFVEIAVPAGCEAALEAAFAAVARVHRLMSFHAETSDLAALRNTPPGSPVAVAAETVEVLRIAALLTRKSGGLFDVTVGARLAAWGFLPTPCSVDPAGLSGTAADIELIDDTHLVCHRPMLIDLGGIAKGFAVDRAVETLLAAGVARGLVNAGGDLRVFGEEPEIVYLRNADGTIESSLEVIDAAIASSSNAHDRRFGDGVEASPHVGRNGVAVLSSDAVTVVAERCVIADAMTKIALVDRALAQAMLLELDGALVARPARRLAA